MWVQYKGGRREGTEFWYYEDGVLASKADYSDGKLWGEYLEFSRSGILLVKGKYRWNHRDGVWKYYYADGKLDYKTNFKMGQEQN